MDIGVTVFQTDLSWHPGELAPELERRGVASLWIPEHTHIPTSRSTPPPTGEAELDEMYKRTLDPFVALAYAAATTERLRIGTGILLPAQRDPIITAKEAATLDHLSGGRLELGIGFGWNEDELADHGVEPAPRVDGELDHATGPVPVGHVVTADDGVAAAVLDLGHDLVG
ncbi:MAG TPA: LLM class flavin-dependent oxidoreductase, partial [Iamia sp.]